MELLYNPEAMSEQEIKATFVARQPLVDKLIAMIESQPDGAGVQHVVIIAPRGMGKTTVLLMVKFSIKDRGLSKCWQVVKFPEESYGINDLADFWIQALELLAVETADDALRIQANALKKKYPNNDALQEAAFAAIKDWRRKHKKRLVLLVENFDQILEQINDEQDNARLRDVLMNDGTVMLIGGATTFFKEARAYDQPLYNFFQIENLADLKFEQMQQLLSSRGQQDAIANFDATLKANAGRLRVLEYFTGGNPRLVLMMYRVITQSELSEVRRGLEKLLDEVTPYYKAKIEALPPQQRKILDHIARISSKTSEGLTPAEIAEAVRLSPNQVSSQLKRLSETGYVRAANMRGRSVPYTLSEPLYAIWHQMRFGRDAHQRMQWLVRFLNSWYEREEFAPESERLTSRFREHIASGRFEAARDALEHHRYLAEAMDDAPSRMRAMEKIIQGHLEIGDGEIVKKELLRDIPLEKLSAETLRELQKNGCVTIQELQQVVKHRLRSLSKHDRQFGELLLQSITAYSQGQLEEALKHLNESLLVKTDNHRALVIRGNVLNDLGRHEDALTSYDKALAIKPDDHRAWFNRGNVLNDLGRHEDALVSFDKALIIKPDYHLAWGNRGIALEALGRYEDALVSYDKVLAIKPDDHLALGHRGKVLNDLGRYEEALVSYNKALAIKPDYDRAWFNHGLILLGQFFELVFQDNFEFEEALPLWEKALESGRRSENEKWPEAVSSLLQIIARSGHWNFVRKLITHSNLEEQLFPLARALDYLLTGDEALIERLSPEVKGIVQEVVDKLRPVAKNNRPAKTRKKR